MSLKFRLPTRRLRTKKPTTLKHTKLRLIRSGCCNSEWFSQRPLLSEKQRGDKNISTYFDCDVLKLLLLLLMLALRSGRWSFVVIEAGSGGWSLCWEDIVGDVYVALAVVVVVVVFDVDDDISPLTFNFCTEFTRNYALSLLRYIAPETKPITFPRLLVVSRMDYRFDFENHIL